MPGSPAESSFSIPDDTPSRRGSVLSTSTGSRPGSRLSISNSKRPGPFQPFERRFSSRLSSSAFLSPRAGSPAFLAPHSRQSSLSSNLFQNQDDSDTPQPPWEVVRWTKLKKITGQLFSEVGKRNFGRPTCLAVAANIAVGTSKGLVLIFDYHQTLVATIGLGTPAVESGGITALAISADHTTVAGGHASGHIFTWEIARPAKPFLHIPPLDRNTLSSRKGDGHVSDSAILHVGFLGTRHTALVSADEGGMAFSHLATRGLGAVARAVKTARLLGRYPPASAIEERPRKPSSVLAFSPLPLGNIERPTDTLGLTALLTPYLLVIVSTTPIAETQHKSPRPKEIEPHSAMSGCLAWFPAVKLKPAGNNNQPGVSKTKLVYCWSNILTILDIETTESSEKDKPADLHFKPRNRWRSEEAIVAVQWLSRSVLGVLTISQRLVILEDSTLRVTDSFDLLHKHINHQDLFSRQLQPVVEQLDEADTSLHGVVADAFYMSFRAYKGRLFLLGFNDVSIGTLSNWADRLLALMEEGDFIAAIDLATAYYTGDAERITVGLPEDDTARHTLVQEKLVEMLSASLKYTFANRQDDGESTQQKNLKDLVSSSFTACLSMSELELLFDDVYQAYASDGNTEGIFFEVLEPYILGEEIRTVPPDVLRDLVTFYDSKGRSSRLEEMICRLDTQAMDINQITILCRQHRLYDALIYVWNQAIDDYITPFIEVLTLLKTMMIEGEEDVDGESLHAPAMKIFPYLAFTFTGRVYPSGTSMDDTQASKAKSDLYGYLFSGREVEWPPGSNSRFSTQEDSSAEPSYPYLRLVLNFDTASFLSMLNEAFEDGFLNDAQNTQTNGSLARRSSSDGRANLLPTRQTIISILLEVMSSDEFGTNDTIYLDMFIARNLPKFPQFIVLPGSALREVVEGLCDFPSEEVAEDCQLSVEYLLSFYHPPDMRSLIPMFRNAGFFRVLKSVYRGAKQYADLLQTYFDDPEDQEEVFQCITDCLRINSGLTNKQTREFHGVMVRHAHDLTTIDAIKTAKSLRSYAPSLLKPILEGQGDDTYAQFVMLQTLLDPGGRDSTGSAERDQEYPQEVGELYVRLMCRYRPSHVAEYINGLRLSDLRLDHVLPAIEASEVVDAAVTLLARDGLMREAMQRLVKHVDTLKITLTTLIEDAPKESVSSVAIKEVLDAVHKYCKVGMWLCQTQTHSHRMSNPIQDRKDKFMESEENLDLDEFLWLELLDVLVSLTKDVTASIEGLDHYDPKHGASERAQITQSLRSALQQSFSAMLTSTNEIGRPAIEGRSRGDRSGGQANRSFLRILRSFLTRASRSSPSLSDLRAVLAEIFSAYTFEEKILNLANQFLDKDVFTHFSEAHELRQRGWRPRSQICEGCKKRVWGPGAGGDVWDAWEAKQEEEDSRKMLAKAAREGGEEARKLARGKGRAVSKIDTFRDSDHEESNDPAKKSTGKVKDPIVVFACRHMWHRSCLERATAQLEEREGDQTERGRFAQGTLRCPSCA
ncbi:hypothetical protein K402DRAFT_326611 [Aulographum hederae CBS 113979]|uniref:Uncharacterized protein n=1 Tax=Aulographum hederae CBS 113979 TaxID=1176131 RepID=A0A6G1H9A1_9PEZI|nr:hypothetical protein K402DRAFT_326611 [Aulographum hederae CBS 113979]